MALKRNLPFQLNFDVITTILELQRRILHQGQVQSSVRRFLQNLCVGAGR